MRACELMTTPVVTAAPELPVQQAARVLLANRIAAMPVLDDGTMVGLVSELDLLWAQTLTDPRRHLSSIPQRAGSACTVADVMSRDVIALPPDTDSSDLVQLMRRERVRSIPIVEGSRLVGIVARRDLLRSISRDDADLLGDLRVTLREALPDGDGWGVAVDSGLARIWPLAGRSPDPALAVLVAAEVPGLLHVQVDGCTPPG